MTAVLFYEKPGCINNTRQKTLLVALGHEVVARNLLTELWTAERLRPFFADRPVVDWFNTSAPRIKSGELPYRELGESEALRLMAADPLLIRRPLIQTESGRMAGFDPCELLAGLGVMFETDQDMQSCPRSAAQDSGSTALAADG
jgi:nitrogenase-associated protein